MASGVCLLYRVGMEHSFEHTYVHKVSDCCCKPARVVCVCVCVRVCVFILGVWAPVEFGRSRCTKQSSYTDTPNIISQLLSYDLIAAFFFFLHG